MRKKWIIVSVILLFLIFCAMIGPIMSDVEHPKYDVIFASDDIEIRQYSPMIIAEVEVAGERKEAINIGFRMLADYIFGNNTVQEKIPMTAPVQRQLSEKIAMTAPVRQQKMNGIWKISFVMPSKYSMDSLPKPNNNKVNLKEIATKKFVVVKFSGTDSDENLKKNEKQLQDYIKANKLSVSGSPKYAFYNPPWTLPFMRRNEIMLEIEP